MANRNTVHPRQFDAINNYDGKFKPTPNNPQFYDLVLRSVDKVSGTNNKAVFNVTLPGLPPYSNDQILYVRSFSVRNASAGALNNAAYTVHLLELLNPNSWSSKNSQKNDALLSLVGYSFNASPTIQDVGAVIIDRGLFYTKNTTIYFDSVDAAFTMTDDWILNLRIYTPTNDNISRL
jgi:hypothetical protein